jgi:hypothetical protein
MGLTTKTLLSALLLTMTLGAQDQEKKLTKKELPSAVLSAFQKSYPKASIKGIAEEKKEGKTYYEIESLDGKTSRDLLYLADGSVAEIEESMATADLPGAVKTTVEAKFPKAKLAKAEKVTKGTEVSYSVVVKTPKGNVTLDVDTTGKVLKEEMPKGKVK